MIFPIVSELLSVVGRHRAVVSAMDGLLRGALETQIAGLTDPAKALVVAHAAATLKRPVVLLTTANERADLLGEAVGYFLAALARRTAEETQVLPALDVTPWDGRAPHPEICEERAATLWRAATGQAAVVVAPAAAALLRCSPARTYQELARTVSDDEELPLEELLEFLRGAGYQREQTVAMPGQFAVRGGIVDVFPPEGMYPVRIELLGDTVESLREFDPETQRSVRPAERVTLLPLVETAGGPWDIIGGGEDGEEGKRQELRRGPGENGERGEKQEEENEGRRGDVFQLFHEPLVMMDEPADIAAAIEEFRERWQRAYDARGAGAPDEPAEGT